MTQGYCCMASGKKTSNELLAENLELRLRLAEVEETLAAIRSGEVDALVVTGEAGERVFTLAGAEHPYRVLVETMNEGAATLVADGTIVYCNSRMAAILGIPLGKIIGTTFSSHVAPSDHTAFVALLGKCLKERCKEEITLLTGGGEPLPVLLSCNALEIAGKRGASIVITDLSEQKKIEEELIKHQLELEARIKTLRDLQHELEISRDRYADLYDHAPLGYVTLDAKGVIREINLVGAELLGREPSLLVGTPLISQIVKNDRKKILKHLSSCKQGMVTVVSTVSLLTERGKLLHLRLHTLPVYDPLQDQTFYRTALTDMNEVASKLEQLIQPQETTHGSSTAELKE